jgi:hypothetical protein
MGRRITIDSAEAPSASLNIEGHPNECPICQHKVFPPNMGFVGAGTREDFRIEECFRCPRKGCGALFIARYRRVSLYEQPEPTFELAELVPRTPPVIEVSDIIQEVSPVFVETYRQSLAAEVAGLTQLTGIGLRKALEFLVKDYAIKIRTEGEDVVSKKSLSQCITGYLQDHNLRACARRAAWLGNDEIHYMRKWKDKDISDLKLLIRLTLNWLENELLTRRYIEEMPDEVGPANTAPPADG